MRRLQDAYYQCIEGEMPFCDEIAEAAANCPAGAYDASCHVMEQDFMALVSKKLISTLSKDLQQAQSASGVFLKQQADDALRRSGR